MKIRSIPVNVNPTPRPSTSSSRGTRVSKDDDLYNSKKTTFSDDLAIMSDLINEDYLRSILKVENLTNLQVATLVLNTSTQTVSHLGELLPNLRRLCLDSSSIVSIRDLGTSLRSVTYLSLNDCRLNELDGIAALATLKELSIRHNSITDVAPLAMLEYLESVDLHGNRIADLAFADALSSCPNFTKLCLTKNPIERAPRYRAVVVGLIPALRVLDGTAVEEGLRGKVSYGMILEAAAAMSLAREEMDDEQRLELDIVEGEKQHTDGSGGSSAIPDTGSDLTHGAGAGVVLVGGMAAALRRRRTADKGIEEDSSALLSMLDFGLENVSDGHPTPANGGPGSTFCEGDVTAQLSNIKDFQVPGHQAMLERVKTAQARVGTASGKPISNNSGGSSARPMTSSSAFSPAGRRPNTSGSLFLQGEFAQDVSTPPRPMTAANGSAPSAPFKVTVDATAVSTASAVGRKGNRTTGASTALEGTKSETSPCNRIQKSKIKARRRSGSDEDSSDSESYAVTHEERHRLMAVSGRVVESPEPEETTQAGLYRGLSAVSAVTRAIPQSLRHETFPDKCLDDEEEMGSPPKLGAALRATSTASLAGVSLGFDLKGSLAAIEQWAGGDGADSNSESESDVKKPRPARVVPGAGLASKREILSRDAIISLCVGESEPPVYEYSQSGKKTRRKKTSTQTQPDILVITHDDSCELDEVGAGLAERPKTKQSRGRKMKSRPVVPAAKEPLTVRPAQQKPSTRPTMKAEEESDGYGDLGDLLMTDFDLGVDSPGLGRSESIRDRQSSDRDGGDRSNISPNRGKGRGKKPSHHHLAGQSVKKGSPTRVPADLGEPAKQASHAAVAVPLSTRVSTTKMRSSRRKQDPQLPTPLVQTQISIDEDDGGDSGRLDTAVGVGVSMSDEKLIHLLTRPPKDTPELKTKSSYQEFFRGMPRQRMLQLLDVAYANSDDGQNKIAKRLQLLNDVLR